MSGKYVLLRNIKASNERALGVELFDLGGKDSSLGHLIPIYRLGDGPVPFVVRREVEADYLLPCA